MPESLPRPLIALTVVVAALAIYVGVKDYLDKKHNSNSAADGNAAVVAYSNPSSAPKKVKHAGSSRGLSSSSRKNTAASVLAEAEDMGKPVVREEFPKPASQQAMMKDESDLGSQGGPESLAAALNQNPLRRGLLDATAATCLPLPNRTNLGDVDAPYYQNWSREYCGQ